MDAMRRLVVRYRTALAETTAERDTLRSQVAELREQLADIKAVEKRNGDAWVERVDYTLLNEQPRLADRNPTAELLAEWAFEDMQATAKGMDAKLVVLLFPFKEQVYWHIAREHLERGGDLSEEDVDAPLRAIGEFLAARSIDYCDLTGPLRSEARKGTQLYLKAGAHWTAAGNRVAAEAVAACLARKGLATLGS